MSLTCSRISLHLHGVLSLEGGGEERSLHGLYSNFITFCDLLIDLFMLPC